jgi:hypothetical protein
LKRTSTRAISKSGEASYRLFWISFAFLAPKSVI